MRLTKTVHGHTVELVGETVILKQEEQVVARHTFGGHSAGKRAYSRVNAPSEVRKFKGRYSTEVNAAAEQATGCAAGPELGKFYDNHGTEISRRMAADLIRECGGPVEVPNAGAGSYEAVAKALGFGEVRVINWTSSAGDWQFGALVDGAWHFFWQENRFPCHGYRYRLDHERGYDSFEDMCKE
jgi:hypothetical protein